MREKAEPGAELLEVTHHGTIWSIYHNGQLFADCYTSEVDAKRIAGSGALLVALKGLVKLIEDGVAVRNLLHEPSGDTPPPSLLAALNTAVEAIETAS